jgi:hypothetical protein
LFPQNFGYFFTRVRILFIILRSPEQHHANPLTINVTIYQYFTNSPPFLPPLPEFWGGKALAKANGNF